MANSSYISDDEIQELVLPYAIQYAQDIHSFSTAVMNAFYGDYSPKIYQRKYGLTRFWETDMAPIPKGFKVTTTYSDAYFGASHHSDEHVFNGPFLEGYHGGPHKYTATPQMSPSPYEWIEQYWDSYSF